MHVLWLIPDYYGFLVEDLRSLAACVDRLSVVSTVVGPELPGCHMHTLPVLRRTVPAIARRLGVVARTWAGLGFPAARGAGSSLLKVARYADFLRTFAREERVDVVHSHFGVPVGTGGFPVLGRTPLVMTLHGVDILSLPEIGYGFRLDRHYERNLRMALQRAHTVTVASEVARNAVRELCGEGCNLRMVPNGIDTALFVRSGRADLIRSRHSLHGKRVVLGVGNLLPGKAFDLLIRAVARLVHTAPELVLVLLGEGPERPRLEALATSEKLSGHVLFAGEVPHEDVPMYLEACDVFAHPSRSEGFGLVVVEAMHMGCTVVAGRTGIAQDLIRTGSNGLLLEESSVDCLSAAISSALADAASGGAMGRAARRLATQQPGLDLRERARTFVSIYEEALEGAAGHGVGQ